MKQAILVFWSGTGNTKKMAELIQKGIIEEGGSIECKEVGSVKPDDINDYSTVILGCPSMGAEVLEEDEMQPFVTSIEGIIKDKKAALFGSYGWGSGEWMEDWQARMAAAGASMLFDSGLIVNEEPAGETEEECIQYGREIAKNL